MQYSQRGAFAETRREQHGNDDRRQNEFGISIGSAGLSSEALVCTSPIPHHVFHRGLEPVAAVWTGPVPPTAIAPVIKRKNACRGRGFVRRRTPPFHIGDFPTRRTLCQCHPRRHKGGGTFGCQGKTISLAIDIFRETVIVGQRHPLVIRRRKNDYGRPANFQE